MEREKEELRNRAIELRNEGRTFSEISKELGVPENTVRDWVKTTKSANLQNPSLTLPPSKEAIQLVSEWLETKEVK